MRLWKVAGMWPDEEDDVRMGDDGVNGENQSLNLGKTQLVNGLLQFVSRGVDLG